MPGVTLFIGILTMTMLESLRRQWALAYGQESPVSVTLVLLVSTFFLLAYVALGEASSGSRS